MRFFHHDQPLTSPLGKKLLAAGYQSIWDYADRRGFTDLETFLCDVDFESLAPVGFEDFVIACADLDRQWDKGYRIFAAYELNRAREQYYENSPSPDWIVIAPVSKLGARFRDEVAWADKLSFTMGDYLLAHRELFDQVFAWDDDWLVKMVPIDGGA